MDTEHLVEWADAAFPQWTSQQLGGLRTLRAGWESDVFGFDLMHDGGTERLVIRLYVGEEGAVKAQREYQGMRQLGEAGYPVPQVYGVESSPEPLGRPFMVMEFVEGDADWPWSAAERMPMFVGLLRRLHTVDWRPFAEPADHNDLAAGRGVERTLDEWRGYLDLFPVPGFGSLMAWLDERLPALPRIEPAVVHWDYHPGNVLVAGDGGAHVVDWTQVGVTDPRFDLAWSGLLMMQSQGRDTLRADYERLSGPMPAMGFFDVAASLKRLYSIVVSLQAGPEAMAMRPEAADLMRDQVHTLGPSYETMQARTGIAIPEVETLLGG